MIFEIQDSENLLVRKIVEQFIQIQNLMSDTIVRAALRGSSLLRYMDNYFNVSRFAITKIMKKELRIFITIRKLLNLTKVENV